MLMDIYPYLSNKEMIKIPINRYIYIYLLIGKAIGNVWKYFLFQGFIGEPGPRGATGPTGDEVSVGRPS